MHVYADTHTNIPLKSSHRLSEPTNPSAVFSPDGSCSALGRWWHVGPNHTKAFINMTGDSSKQAAAILCVFLRSFIECMPLSMCAEMTKSLWLLLVFLGKTKSRM